LARLIATHKVPKNIHKLSPKSLGPILYAAMPNEAQMHLQIKYKDYSFNERDSLLQLRDWRLRTPDRSEDENQKPYLLLLLAIASFIRDAAPDIMCGQPYVYMEGDLPTGIIGDFVRDQ